MESLSITTLTNQDISSPLMAASYSSGQNREVLANVYMESLAGNGAYRACITKQIDGLGTAYQSPTSVISLASSTCTALLTTTVIPVTPDDLIRVYVQGLAGDTLADVKTEIFDATTASVVGSVGLSGSALSEIAASVATACGVWVYATRALTDKTEFGLSGSALGEISASLPAAGAAASDVWAYTTRTLTASAISACTFDDDAISATASAVWSYGSRTLTQTAQSVVDTIVNGTGKITLRRGDSQSVSITGLGDISDRSELWFTAKKHKGQSDIQAQIMISEGSGLHYINGTAPILVSNGAIAVNSAASGNITITLGAPETANLVAYPSYFYDVQVKRTSSSINTLTENMLEVTDDVTHTVG